MTAQYMGRNIDDGLANIIYSKYLKLKSDGIPDIEIQRAIMSEFAYGSMYADPWPPKVTGIDQQAPYTDHIPASSYPPYEGITEPGELSGMDWDLSTDLEIGEVEIPSSLNWTGTASTVIGGASMTNEEPAFNKRQLPEESFYPWGDNIKEAQQLAKYKYNTKENCPICAGFNGMIFDLSGISGRPVLPSEGLAYTTNHPNCLCTWEMIDPLYVDQVEESDLLGDQKSHISQVNRIIGQKSRHGTLHWLNTDGSLTDFTTNVNPRKMMETVGELKSQFQWLTPNYMDALKSKDWPGKIFLIRAAAETETDHRIEGEPYKRKLDGNELVAMARTAIGKGMDINHNSEWRTNAIVLDSEGDAERKEIQMIVLETDPEIIAAINKGTISAVSINGGAPRTEEIAPCGESSELCMHPRGVVLGELDGIALTYVVTDPNGMIWHGQKIGTAEPGIKSTKLELL